MPSGAVRGKVGMLSEFSALGSPDHSILHKLYILGYKSSVENVYFV